MLWPVLARAGSSALHQLHIVLKADLRTLPLMGWATSMARSIFLSRRWAADEPHLRAMLTLLSTAADTDGAGYVLLLFPEGTDLSPARAAQNAVYGAAHGLPSLEQTLHPRIKGLETAVQALRGSVGSRIESHGTTLDAIYDATLAYRGRVVNEGGFLSGAGPSEVHCHVTRIAAADLPPAGAPFEAWLRARFAEKEAALRKFYAHTGLSLPAAAGADAADTSAAAVSGASVNGAVVRAYASGTVVVVACATALATAIAALGPLLTVTACIALHGLHLATVRFLGGADRVELRLTLPSEAAVADAAAARGRSSAGSSE